MRSLKYVNSAGEEVNLSGDGIICSLAGMDDWELDYRSLNGRSAGFRLKPKAYNMTLVFASRSTDAGLRSRDRLFEAANRDIEARSPGRLYDGEWYVECYLAASSKDGLWHMGRSASCSVKVLMDDPAWTREHLSSYWAPNKGSTGSLDYPHNYPYNYRARTIYNRVIENPGIAPAPLRLVIYGPVDEPRATIGGNVYEVAAPLSEGDLLIVDGKDKTVTLVRNGGGVENAFGKRVGIQKEGSGSYLFQRIPPGLSSVNWSGTFGFDATVYERRIERRWSA